MNRIDRLPAVPLIATDPYLSIWMPADTMNETDSAHWCGPIKPIRGEFTVDGAAARFLGAGEAEPAEMTALSVTPTKTAFTCAFKGVELQTEFVTPALPDDWDVLSMPITLVRFSVSNTDGKAHQVRVHFTLSDRICYDGDIAPRMTGRKFVLDGANVAWRGQAQQKPLSNSGDHITIDWGYLYLASQSEISVLGNGLALDADLTNGEASAVIAYDDLASINYFGDFCKAWYRRNGMQITDAIRYGLNHFAELLSRCEALDARVLKDASAEGEAYEKIIAAAWRHTFCAHKLIATPAGEPALLSKENDSNGCIGTVDVSYPSIPIFLKYSPELVNALCRPVLEFASMPVWKYDFAPHDVGRYPNVLGQVYALNHVRAENGDTYPYIYLYPETEDIYENRWQMPVEESGNMLIMLEAAREYGADPALANKYRALTEKWVQYLLKYGSDPGEQLCTDDFAGHLAHNINLAFKAVVGVACYSRLVNDASYAEKAKEMAAGLLEKVGTNGDAPLTLDGNGWSMKYNLLWDRVLKLNLFPDAFYRNETRSYLKRINRYGLPLDSRADYTKSDWICWTATMSEERDVRDALLQPIAAYLRETASRVAFSDWYDTKTGRYEHFIARSVQGGLFALMLKPLNE